MAGILNNKERVIDFLITRAGKEKISQGRLRPDFVTLTDSHTFYQALSSLEPNVAEDSTNRIFFEATDKHQDVIVPELDPGNFMQPFRSIDLLVDGSNMVDGTFRTGSMLIPGPILTGSSLLKKSNVFLNALATHFKDHQILSTKDQFSDTTDFQLSHHTASFVVSEDTYDFELGPYMLLDNMPNIASDARFSHLPNFMFLPPENVDPVEGPLSPSPEQLGNYPNIQAFHPALGGKFHNSQQFSSWLSDRQKVSFTFKDTSKDNNMLGQFFEINNPSSERGIEKLAVVDLGVWTDLQPEGVVPLGDMLGNDNLVTAVATEVSAIGQEPPPTETVAKRVYSVGRVRKDRYGSTTFIGLFTLVYE